MLNHTQARPIRDAKSRADRRSPDFFLHPVVVCDLDEIAPNEPTLAAYSDSRSYGSHHNCLRGVFRVALYAVHPFSKRLQKQQLSGKLFGVRRELSMGLLRPERAREDSPGRSPGIDGGSESAIALKGRDRSPATENLSRPYRALERGFPLARPRARPGLFSHALSGRQNGPANELEEG